MDRREELVREEDRAFAQLSLALRRVPPGRLEDPVLPQGWSVRDLLWHLACWYAECARALERIRLGTYEGWEQDADALNARFLEEGRRQDPETVRATLAAARTRMLQELWAFPGPPPPQAVAWFAESGPEHEREHLADLRAAFPGPQAPPG